MELKRIDTVGGTSERSAEVFQVTSKSKEILILVAVIIVVAVLAREHSSQSEEPTPRPATVKASPSKPVEKAKPMPPTVGRLTMGGFALGSPLEGVPEDGVALLSRNGVHIEVMDGRVVQLSGGPLVENGKLLLPPNPDREQCLSALGQPWDRWTESALWQRGDAWLYLCDGSPLILRAMSSNSDEPWLWSESEPQSIPSSIRAPDSILSELK